MVELKINIPDDKFEDFKNSFLSLNPIPVNEETNTPLYSENVWIKKCVINFLKKNYYRGKQKIILENTIINNIILE